MTMLRGGLKGGFAFALRGRQFRGKEGLNPNLAFLRRQTAKSAQLSAASILH